MPAGARLIVCKVIGRHVARNVKNKLLTTDTLLKLYSLSQGDF